MRCGGRREELVLPHFHDREDNPSSKAHSFRLPVEEKSNGEVVRQRILKFVRDFIFICCKKNYINLRDGMTGHQDNQQLTYPSAHHHLESAPNAITYKHHAVNIPADS